MSTIIRGGSNPKVFKTGESTAAAIAASAQTKADRIATEAARDAALAAGSSGGAKIFNTKAAANAAIGTIAANAYVQVLADETVGGAWTIYQKVSGAYVYRGTTSTGGIEVSAGAADAGKTVKLDGGGRLDRTLFAPDGYQRQKRIVLSESGDVANLGDFSGTTFASYVQMHGGPVALDTQNCGTTLIVWGNHSKGTCDYVGKSRGAGIGDFAPCQIGDTVYRKFAQASGTGTAFGHVGVEGWEVDGTPTNSGEIAGLFYITTDTGLHVSEADPARPTYYGLKRAFLVNRRQQAYFPGVLTIAPSAGSLYPAIVSIGKCGPNAGEANIAFDLTGSVLMTTPVAGCLEVDANGRIYMTDVNAKRDAVLVGQVKVSGDSGAVAAGAGAGTGPTISVVWGNGWARVTVTTGISPTAGGVLFTLTYPHTFASQSSAMLQAGNSSAANFASKCFTTPGTSNVVVTLGAGISATASTTYIIDVIFTGN